MLGVFLGLASLALLTLIASAVWAMRERGTTKRRSGPAVHAEIVSAQVEHDTRLRGENLLAKRVWAGGTGHGVEVEASYSTDEIVRAFRTGRLRPILPGLLLGASLLGLLVFGGLALVALSGPASLLGLGLIGMALYGAFQLGSGLRAAARRADGADAGGVAPE